MGDRTQLYDLAFEYKKTKLWKKIAEDRLFATRFSDGVIGYFNVLGEADEYVALAIYFGEEGIQNYLRLQECQISSAYDFSWEEIECFTRQDGIYIAFVKKEELLDGELERLSAYSKSHKKSLKGKNAYPSFVRLSADCLPWKIKEEEELYIKEALEVTLMLAEKIKKEKKWMEELWDKEEEIPLFEKIEDSYQLSKIPYPEKKPEQFPRPKPLDEFTAASIRIFKRMGVLEMELTILPFPVQRDMEEAPHCPFALIVALQKGGEAFLPILSEGIGYDPDEVLKQFLERLRECKKRPSKLLVRNEKTFALFEDFGEKTGIKVEICEDLPELDELEEAMMETMNEMDDEYDEYDEYDEEEEIEKILEMVEMLDDLPYEKLSEVLPPETEDILKMLLLMGDIGEKKKKKVKHLLDRIQMGR